MRAEINSVQQACEATQFSGWEETIIGAHAAVRVQRERGRECASSSRQTQNPTSPFPPDRSFPLFERGLHHFVAKSGQLKGPEAGPDPVNPDF